jgi:hypothetical protein
LTASSRTPKTKNVKTIYIKRLQKLITFLRTLPRKRFNFAIVRNEPPKCGAVGCAIGYMPNVFPRVFKSEALPHVSTQGVKEGWDWTHGVKFRSAKPFSFEEVGMWVSGLDFYKAGRLFTPEMQSRVHSDLEDLSESATPKQVARMLEKFIKLQTESK